MRRKSDKLLMGILFGDQPKPPWPEPPLSAGITCTLTATSHVSMRASAPAGIIGSGVYFDPRPAIPVRYAVGPQNVLAHAAAEDDPIAGPPRTAR